MGRKENLANARNIFSEIMMKISNDKEEWKEFLKFSSKFYKYSFTENLLMYAQNKDVTMCATLEEWNSIGRWVKPKSQSLKILKDAENDTYLEYVFDVKDTYARSDIPNANICTDQSAHFGLVDYIDDIDAVNIGNIINQYNFSLPEAFRVYYILKDVTNVLECDTRSTRFMNSMGTTAFNQLCYNINIDDFPTNVLKALLAGSSTEQYYIDAAILAFKNFVNNEVLNGR